MDHYTPTKETQMEYDNDTLLETAVATWEDGGEIPLDIEVELLGRGYDVAGLRKLHQTF
jgi:hypothetical protein